MILITLKHIYTPTPICIPVPPKSQLLLADKVRNIHILINLGFPTSHKGSILFVDVRYPTVQRTNAEHFKQIFPEELRGHSPNFHSHVPVSDLYIPTIDLPIILQENIWIDPGNI